MYAPRVLGADPAAAFEMLKTISQNSNVKLHEVTQKIAHEKDLRSAF